MPVTIKHDNSSISLGDTDQLGDIKAVRAKYFASEMQLTPFAEAALTFAPKIEKVDGKAKNIHKPLNILHAKEVALILEQGSPAEKRLINAKLGELGGRDNYEALAGSQLDLTPVSEALKGKFGVYFEGYKNALLLNGLKGARAVQGGDNASLAGEVDERKAMERASKEANRFLGELNGQPFDVAYYRMHSAFHDVTQQQQRTGIQARGAAVVGAWSQKVADSAAAAQGPTSRDPR